MHSVDVRKLHDINSSLVQRQLRIYTYVAAPMGKWQVVSKNTLKSHCERVKP